MNAPKTENILIVDDEKIIVSLLQCLLKDEGHIDVADNGKMALDLITDKYYKLIISDVQMPVMDGLTLYLKASAKYPHMKSRFLFITGSLDPIYQSFFEKYDLKYMCKPTKMEDLRQTVRQVIRSDYGVS